MRHALIPKEKVQEAETGNPEKDSCFFAPIFVIFKNSQYYAVQGGLKKFPLPFGKSVSLKYLKLFGWTHIIITVKI